MLLKLIELKDAPAQAQYLTELIKLCSKNIREFVTELNDHLVQKLISEGALNKANFIQWLQLSINLLSVQECFQYAPADQNPTTPALKLVDAIGSLQADSKQEKINTLLIKYSSLQLSIVLHSFLAKHCIKGVPEKRLPRLLPIFIKLSSYIVEKYFQLKNEPSKGTEDRMEDDKIILKCCEKWLATNIAHFFLHLPTVHDSTVKELVLIAVGDVMGALMETDRENLLDKQLTSNLLENVLLAYCRRNYTHNEIYCLFMKSLNSRQFNNPLRKIQIPEIYSEDVIIKIGLNTQAYAYIIVRLLKSGLLATESSQNLLKMLIPAASEIMIRPYEIKIEVIYLLESLVQAIKPINVSTGFDHGYPIQLFFFYLFQCEEEKYPQIRDAFVFDKQEHLVNSLLVLQDIIVENLQKEKEHFILRTIEKNEAYNQRVFIFARKIPFKEEKAKAQVALLQLMAKMKPKYPKEAEEVLEKWRKLAGEWMEPSVKTKMNELGL